ncbi:MAG: spermine synthase [Armatimonadetes bacterium]|nr:spermine synthase [Armatimonadota bacterium]
MIVLSHFQVAPILKAKEQGLECVLTSLDLNITQSEVVIEEGGVCLTDGQHLNWEQLREVAEQKNACYVVSEESLERVYFFSPRFQRAYSLYPTERAPTMLLASFPMHRIKGIDPQEDTRRKIRAIAPIYGRVLDTTMGLGYTVIEAARTATEIQTIEMDATVLEVARRNPWSQELFTNPKITTTIGSAADVVLGLPSEGFHFILHDPPTFKLAGELYSEAFYRELFRVLKRNGKLFHYVGDLESAHGSSVVRGVIRRLQEVGFKRITKAPEAFGVVATK